MINRKIIAELINVANELDEKQYSDQANNLTKIAERLAQFGDEMTSAAGESDVNPDTEHYNIKDQIKKTLNDCFMKIYLDILHKQSLDYLIEQNPQLEVEYRQCEKAMNHINAALEALDD